MPFEPLRTDEPLEGPVKREPDYEMKLMSGCGFTTVLAFLCYGMVSWPYYGALAVHTLPGLSNAVIFGLSPALILGAIATRKAGPPAAAGFLGGTMAASVFIYLLLRQVDVGRHVTDLPQPEWPSRIVWVVPLFTGLIAFLVAAAFFPYREYSTEPSEPAR